jgi:acetyltransferase
MVTDGTELVIGMTTDPSFGPLVMFGMGGVFVEVLNDVAFRVHPLTDVDAREMIADIRGYPLLQGARGRRKVDVDKLADIILRVSHLVAHFPGIDQIDINPLIAGSERFECAAVDARIIPVSPSLGKKTAAAGRISA